MTSKVPEASAYREAGVNLEEAQAALDRLRGPVESTYTPGVLRRPGLFAGFYSWPQPNAERLLVASMDGVGTKMRIAGMARRFRGAGYDIVSHCVNDILVHGATPLFFLDYLGAGKLEAAVVGELVEGMAEACREANCALLGGETAEMPGIYAGGDWEVVGTIVGEVSRRLLIDGSAIRAGDRILALRSQGLHTNGYSLARRILDLEAHPERLGETPTAGAPTWADLLLARHRMYLPLLRPLLEDPALHGLVHLTGGGLLDNTPRVLAPDLDAVVRRGSWEVPIVFKALVERGQLDDDESHRVFNMGLGMLLIVAPAEASRIAAALGKLGETPLEIGWIEAGTRRVRWARPGETG